MAEFAGKKAGGKKAGGATEVTFIYTLQIYTIPFHYQCNPNHHYYYQDWAKIW